MKVRLLSTLAALVLAIIGAVLIATYVQSADQRALAGTKTREVLVVQKPVAAGTAVDALSADVAMKTVPVSAVAEDAMSSLSAAPNTVTGVDLVPGEQLLRSRLVSPSALQVPGTVQIPKGLEAVTVQLGPDKGLGGNLKAGDMVGVFISFPGSGSSPATTHLQFPKVLVTNVQGATAQVQSGSAGSPSASAKSGSSPTAPTASMLVTFALSAPDAETVIFAAQYGTIWLSGEPPTSNQSGTRIVTEGGVYH